MHFPALHWTLSFNRKESKKKFSEVDLYDFYSGIILTYLRCRDFVVLIVTFFGIWRWFCVRSGVSRKAELGDTINLDKQENTSTISVLGLVHRNMVNFHQGLNRIACLGMHNWRSKYCWAFTLRCSYDNTKVCSSN